MNKPQFVYTTYIRTTPEKLWAALTTPEFTRQYWGGMENKAEWKKGSTWQHIDPDDNHDVMVTGRILECDPPKRLVLTWAVPADLTDDSRVSFDISVAGDMVQLDVVHGEFNDGSPMAKKITWGWPRVLSSLKSYLETGRGMNPWCGELPEWVRHQATK